MRKRKYFGLLAMLMIGFFTLLAPTAAKGYDDFVGTGTDDLDQTWTVTSSIGDCGFDRKGGPIPGILFKYVVTPPEGLQSKVIQANVDFNLCEPLWTLTWPSNNSVKIRDCDPNAPFRCDDPNKDVVTFDSITYSNGTSEFSFCANGASIEKATVQLKTEFGNVIVPGLGPGCCGETQTTTQITDVIGTGSNFTYEVTVDSGDKCVFKPATVSISDGIEGGEQEYGVAHCAEGRTPGTYDKNTCVKISKLGPESGLYVLSKLDPACDAETGCLGYAYYGWGNKIYRFGPLFVPASVDTTTACDSSIRNVPWKGSVVIDDTYKFEPDGCGNGEIYKLVNGDEILIAGPDTQNDPIWLVPYDSSGRLISSEASVVVAGSAEGVVFFNGCQIIGGRYVCR